MVVYRAGGQRTKCDDTFSRFDTIRACNGRTDRQLSPHYANTLGAVKTAEKLVIWNLS